MPDDFLAEKRQEIDSRLKELRPLAEEYARLQVAAEALDAIPGAGPPAASPNGRRRRGPGRPPGSKAAKPTAKAPGGKPKAPGAKAKAAGGRRGRRKGTGERASEALQVVVDNPGITIPEIAAKMGIKQNYLYRVLPGLEGEGQVKKQGRGWHPLAAAA